MNYCERKEDLFEFYSKNMNFILIQCISSDFEMVAGIAVQFNKVFNCKNIAKRFYIQYWEYKGTILPLLNHNAPVINLITKQYYFNKPTYKTMEESLLELKNYVVNNNIKSLAMPKIGCGIDKLQWGKVRDLIQRIFEELDIDITVCYIR